MDSPRPRAHSYLVPFKQQKTFEASVLPRHVFVLHWGVLDKCICRSFVKLVAWTVCRKEVADADLGEIGLKFDIRWIFDLNFPYAYIRTRQSTQA